MQINDILKSSVMNEDGKIVPGVNTTVDVKPGETQRQAARFGNKINSKGEPPLLHKKAKKNTENNCQEFVFVLTNLGLTESFAIDKKRWADVLPRYLETVEEKMEEVDSTSIRYHHEDPIYLKLEKDYRALMAVQTVINNHQMAIQRQIPDNYFLYSFDFDKEAFTALQVAVVGRVGEIKWLGSYNNPGAATKLVNNIKPLLKEKGVKKIELTAKWGSEGFYEKLNFKRDGETHDDPVAGTTFTDMSKSIDESEGNDISSFAKSLEQKYNLKSLFLSDLASRNAIEISSIIVDRTKQKAGTGSAVMQEIVDYADKNGRILVLDPAIIDRKHGTTSQSRLRRFYKRFGFKDNKGRNKNYEFRHLMIRYPTTSVSESQSGPAIGYKVMSYDPSSNKLVSAADQKIKATLTKGEALKMPAPGIYMSSSEDFVRTYYSGLNNHEVLLTLQFNAEEVTSGNLTDQENEFTVPRAKIVDYEILEPLEEVKIDNVKGRGAVPYNQDVDYRGLRVAMLPSTFLDLAAPLSRDAHDEMKDYIRNGGAIGAPFLMIEIPEEGAARVVGHEGRNRMKAILDVEGDNPIEVHLLFRGRVNRARHLTPEIVDQIKNLLAQEKTGTHRTGPLWEKKTQESIVIGKGIEKTATLGTDFAAEFDIAKNYGKKVGKISEFEVWTTENRVIYWALTDETVVGMVQSKEKFSGDFHHDFFVTNHAVVNPDFRGKGIVLSLYKWMINKGITLVSDDIQSLGGIKLWRRLAKTPGINVYTVELGDREPTYHHFDPDDWTESDKIVYQGGSRPEQEELVYEIQELKYKLADIEDWLIDAEELDLFNEDEIDQKKAEEQHYKKELELAQKELEIYRDQESKNARLMAVKDKMPVQEQAIKKPHPRDTLGVKRADMPQVHRDHYPKLIDYLSRHGNKFIQLEVDAKHLKPVQSEFSDQGVKKMMRTDGRPSDSEGKNKKPLIVSADNYIIDGHHRWLAAYNLGEKVPIMQSSLPIKKLFQLVKEFPHTTYKTIHESPYTQLELAMMEGGHNLDDLTENISITGTERQKLERKKKLQPGTEAWFKHWFSLPYLKKEDVSRLKNETTRYLKEKQHAKKTRQRKFDRS